MSQDRRVVNLVPCPQCKVGQGQYCVFRTGPNERIGTRLKECHPERTNWTPSEPEGD